MDKVECPEIQNTIINLSQLAVELDINLNTKAGKRKANRTLCKEIIEKTNSQFDIDSIVPGETVVYDESNKKAFVLTKFKYLQEPMRMPANTLLIAQYISGKPFMRNGTEVVKVYWHGFSEPSDEAVELLNDYKRGKTITKNGEELTEMLQIDDAGKDDTLPETTLPPVVNEEEEAEKKDLDAEEKKEEAEQKKVEPKQEETEEKKVEPKQKEAEEKKDEAEEKKVEAEEKKVEEEEKKVEAEEKKVEEEEKKVEAEEKKVEEEEKKVEVEEKKDEAEKKKDEAEKKKKLQQVDEPPKKRPRLVPNPVLFAKPTVLPIPSMLTVPPPIYDPRYASTSSTQSNSQFSYTGPIQQRPIVQYRPMLPQNIQTTRPTILQQTSQTSRPTMLQNTQTYQTQQTFQPTLQQTRPALQQPFSRPLASSASTAFALKKDIIDSVEPCQVGNVDRCCLLRQKTCGKYTVDLLDETIIGTIENEIANGTFGSVYRTSNNYAVKAFKDRKGTPFDINSPDLREMTILRNLIHINVILVHQVAMRKVSADVAELGMAMTYFPKTIYKTNFSTDRTLRATILYQLLRAVAFIHSRGVWHRDIKPQNILWNPANYNQIALTDFGLAQGLAIQNNRYLSNVVTSWYRAPELFLKDERYSSAIDIWSVGATWLEMLGSLFFTPENQRLNTDFYILRLIFMTVGWPSAQNYPAALSLPNWEKFLKEVPIDQRYKIKYNIREKLLLPGRIGVDEYDLLIKTLHLDPTKRTTAQDALRYKFFDSVRQTVNEKLFARPLPPEQLSNCGAVLLAMELNPVGDYLEKDADAKTKITKMLTWLKKINSDSHYNHRISTWVFALSIFHRFAAVTITKNKASLLETLYTIGITCYMIATKLDADYIGNVIFYAEQTAGVLSEARIYENITLPSEVVKVQQNILRALDMDLDRPTAATFLERIANAKVLEKSVFANVSVELNKYLLSFDDYVANRASKLVVRAIMSQNVGTDCTRRLQTVFPELFA